MARRPAHTIRSVVVSLPLDPVLREALFDVRSAINSLIPDWRSHPEESRYDATKRTYGWTRAHYPHLASAWAVSIANETSATLNSWDRQLRRAKRLDRRKWERLHRQVPRRVRLKVSLHRSLYRLRGRELEITVNPDIHVAINLLRVRNPLLERYGVASDWDFGLTLTDRGLVFQFRGPRSVALCPDSVGVDVNMPSADFVSSDGVAGSVDLRPITRVQGAMARKRQSIQRRIPKDLRLQRRVLRRSRTRERHRVDPLLHRAANELLERVGNRNIVLEDLSTTQEELMRTTQGKDARRRLSVWTQSRFQRIVEYKARTQVVHVDPRGTSSDCPRCGGRLDHPEWRRSVCGNCQGDWHRDGAAATSILCRGQVVLWGAAPPPNALDALLELSRWGPPGGSVGGR
jgi:IS605 OrfB family transposase